MAPPDAREPLTGGGVCVAAELVLLRVSLLTWAECWARRAAAGETGWTRETPLCAASFLFCAHASLSLQMSSYSTPVTSFPRSTPLSMRIFAVYLASSKFSSTPISPR